MRRGNWNWNIDPSRVENVASMQVCLALLRIYRDVSLPIDKLERSSVAASFWPLLRIRPQPLLAALQAYKPRDIHGQAIAVDSELLDACEAAIAANGPLPIQPIGTLHTVSHAIFHDAPCFRSLLDSIEEVLKAEIARHPLEIDPTIRVLSELLALSNHEEAFVRLAAAVELSPIDSGAFACASGHRHIAQALRAALALPSDSIASQMFRYNGILGRGGLLAERRGVGDLQDRLALSKRAWHLLGSQAFSLSQMAELVLENLPEPAQADLEWPHLQAPTALLTPLLANAVKSEATGVNILVYGPSGTGC